MYVFVWACGTSCIDRFSAEAPWGVDTSLKDIPHAGIVRIVCIVVYLSDYLRQLDLCVQHLDLYIDRQPEVAVAS